MQRYKCQNIKKIAQQQSSHKQKEPLKIPTKSISFINEIYVSIFFQNTIWIQKAKLQKLSSST
jgi:hypothetical protein